MTDNTSALTEKIKTDIVRAYIDEYKGAVIADALDGKIKGFFGKLIQFNKKYERPIFVAAGIGTFAACAGTIGALMGFLGGNPLLIAVSFIAPNTVMAAASVVTDLGISLLARKRIKKDTEESGTLLPRYQAEVLEPKLKEMQGLNDTFKNAALAQQTPTSEHTPSQSANPTAPEAPKKQ